MRTASLSTVGYSPAAVPSDPAQIPRFLQDELLKIQAAIQALADGHLDKVYAAPSKPRDGDIRYADGTSFKPNGTGGIGIWYYKESASTWVQLG